MINKIGTRAHDYPKGTEESIFDLIAADGWQSVQLAILKSVSGLNGVDDITPQIILSLKNALEKNKLELSVLGAYVELGLVDSAKRKQEVQKFLKQMQFAKALGAKCIASETTAFATQPLAAQKDAINAVKASLFEIMPLAQELNLTVAIEPVHYHSVSNGAIAKQIIDDIQSKNLGIVFDPVNLLSAETIANQQQILSEFLHLLGDKINTVHIKGFDGAPLQKSLLQSEYVLKSVDALPQNIALLREETVPHAAKADIEFLKANFANKVATGAFL